jgi:hypothetical protein
MPLVIGRAVHLHPVITIFAVLVGLSTWGILGGLLAVPVAAALNVTLRELYPEETGDLTGRDERSAATGGPRTPRLRRARLAPPAARATIAEGPMARRESVDPATEGEVEPLGDAPADPPADVPADPSDPGPEDDRS